MVEIYNLNNELVYSGNMSGGSRFLNDHLTLYNLKSGRIKYVPKKYNYKIVINGKEFHKKIQKGKYFFLGDILKVKGIDYKVVEIGKLDNKTYITLEHENTHTTLEFSGNDRVKYNTLYRRIQRGLWEWIIFLIKTIT